jgi:hypothetical protein
MSLILPEVVIQNTIDNILAFIKADWIANATKSNTVLYKLWNGVIHGNYDYYVQAQSVFLKTDANQRLIKIRPSYPRGKSEFPCVIVNIPSESSGGTDGMGFDENREAINYNDDDLKFTENASRSFTSTYSVIIFSDNRNEVSLIYETLKAFFILLSYNLSEDCAIDNLKISGREMQMMTDVLPEGTFIRALQLSGFHSVTVENFIANSMVQSFTFTGTPIESSLEIS